MTKKLQCVLCENIAKDIILDECCIDYLDVCEECYKEVFCNVANSGAEVFYEWSVEMYGADKGFKFTKDIFGESAISRLGFSDELVGALESEEYVTMFTYGILKYPSNIEREGGVNIVENCIVRGHKMYLYNNSFPITRKTDNKNDVIYGTLFEIPLSYVLTHYDFIEGYNPNQSPYRNMYNRIDVEVKKPDGETVRSQMYLANDKMFAKDLVDKNLLITGNFDDRVKAYSIRKDRRR